MKNDNIMKALKTTIRTSYPNLEYFWNDISFWGDSAKKDYRVRVSATKTANYNLISHFYSNELIDGRQFNLLDRYNDRLETLYYYRKK